MKSRWKHPRQKKEDIKKRKLKEMSGSEPSRLSDDAECLKMEMEIINAIKRPDQKMENLSKRT